MSLVVPDRPHVWLLAPTLSGGGSERVVVHLANHLDRERFEVTLMLGRRRGPLLGAVAPHVRVQQVYARHTLKAGLLLARRLFETRPQVMLSTLGFGFSAALARRIAGVPTRLIVRESNMPSLSWQNAARRSRGRALTMRWNKWVGYRGADRVVCQSRAMAADIAAHFPEVAGKLCCIGNPVDIDLVQRLAESEPPAWPPAPGRHLVAVGRLAWQKGYDLLLPAVREALVSHPELHLTILGKGAERESLDAQAAQLGIRERVHFLGFVENPYAYLARADALVLTSRYEGLPNVVLEAHALGVPVIATDAPGGTGEVVQPGFNGYLCEPNVERIAATLTKALDTLTTLEREAIRKHATQEHASRRIAAQYEDLIQHTLQATQTSEEESEA